MFLDKPDMHFDLLAPVQATAFVTGILGTVSGTDANGRQPGGGGVSSFAFNSNPTAVAGASVTVEQDRQLALMDIVGTSSAFFAEMLQNLFMQWRGDTGKLFNEIEKELDEILDWIEQTLPGPLLMAARGLFLRERMQRASKDQNERELIIKELKSILDEVKDLIPQYAYWPVRAAAPTAETKPTRFADGGG